MQILESLSIQSQPDLFFCSLSPGSGLTNRGSQSGAMTTLGQNQNLISSYSSPLHRLGPVEAGPGNEAQLGPAETAEWRQLSGNPIRIPQWELRQLSAAQLKCYKGAACEQILAP